MFPWRRPAALNGGRVVYLNGYWVAWLPAPCPVGRKLTRVGQKKGAGIRKTNVDIVGAPIDPGVYTCALYVPTWVRSFRACSTLLPLFFSFFFLFFFEKRSSREKQAFQRRSKLFAAVTSFDYSARRGRTAILRGKRVLRRNTRTQRCNRKEQCRTYSERRECWLRRLYADSANLDISWLSNGPSTLSFRFIFVSFHFPRGTSWLA